MKEVVIVAGARTREYSYNRAGQLQTQSVDAKSGDIRCVTDPGYTSALCDREGSAQPGLRDWYKFDPLDRLKAFKSYRTNATVDTSYVYDAFDRVSTQTEVQNGGAARTSSFTYLETTNEISSETQTGGASSTKRYTYDLTDDRIDATITTSSTQDYSYGRNVHGDVSLLVDDNGLVSDSYAYKPYGNLDGSLSRGEIDPTNPFNAFRFNDKRFDSGSRSFQMGARHYEPDDGRFLQQDFLRDATGELEFSTDLANENRYGFAGGNPVSFVESDGHVVVPDGGGGAPKPPSLTKRQRMLIRKLQRVSVSGTKIVNPRLTVIVASRTHMPITLGCALLTQESCGGYNVWGADPTIFIRGYDAKHKRYWGRRLPCNSSRQVTKDGYLAYKRQRGPTGRGGMQGVGPMQLTYYTFQDKADARGGAWRPLPNMIVGFQAIVGDMRKSGLTQALINYNGASSYAVSVERLERRWAKALGLKSIQR